MEPGKVEWLLEFLHNPLWWVFDPLLSGPAFGLLFQMLPQSPPLVNSP